MFTWKEYFGCFGVLLVFYSIARVVIWAEWKRDLTPLPPSEPVEGETHPIDTSPLADRLRDVRQDYHGEIPVLPSTLNRSMTVASRREEIAKLAFFQKPPPPEPEPPDHDRGSLLLFSL